jgi:hypothetical protein
MGNVDPSTARRCNSVINQKKLHRKGVDSTGERRQDFSDGIGEIRKPHPNAVPLRGGAGVPASNAQGIQVGDGLARTRLSRRPALLREPDCHGVAVSSHMRASTQPTTRRELDAV